MVFSCYLPWWKQRLCLRSVLFIDMRRTWLGKVH